MVEVNLEDLEVAYLNDMAFRALLKALRENGVDTRNVDDDLAFAIKAETPIIIFRDRVKRLTKDEQMIIIAHETAHLEGIMDEEEADRWALKALPEESQRKILMEQWEHRHGHKYEEGD